MNTPVSRRDYEFSPGVELASLRRDVSWLKSQVALRKLASLSVTTFADWSSEGDTGLYPGDNDTHFVWGCEVTYRADHSYVVFVDLVVKQQDDAYGQMWIDASAAGSVWYPAPGLAGQYAFSVPHILSDPANGDYQIRIGYRSGAQWQFLTGTGRPARLIVVDLGPGRANSAVVL